MGYFRDDTPLIELILDEKGKKELDTLWEEFDFIADYTVRTYSQFVFNRRRGGRRACPADRPSANEFATRSRHLSHAGPVCWPERRREPIR